MIIEESNLNLQLILEVILYEKSIWWEYQKNLELGKRLYNLFNIIILAYLETLYHI